MVSFVYPVWRGEPHSCNFRFFHLENPVFLPCHCHHWADCSITVIVPLPHTTHSLPRPFKLNQDVQLMRWSRRSWSAGKGMLEPLPPANRALPCHFPPHNGGQTLPPPHGTSHTVSRECPKSRQQWELTVEARQLDLLPAGKQSMKGRHCVEGRISQLRAALQLIQLWKA